MKMTSFSINGRAVSRLSINGREVSLKREPVFCDALCFTAEQPGSTVGLTGVFSPEPLNLLISYDYEEWITYKTGDTITLANVGDKVYFRANGQNTRTGKSNGIYHKFVMTGTISASGNINSLLTEDENLARNLDLSGRDYCFSRLFENCSSLKTPPKLPSTIIPNYAYRNMFLNCTALTKAPELPATTLADYCYESMFYGCTSLETVPELSATTLANNCCEYMFFRCSSLNYVKVGFTNWAGSATNQWLPNNVGTFECPWDLITNTSTRNASTVPSKWTMVAV